MSQAGKILTLNLGLEDSDTFFVKSKTIWCLRQPPSSQLPNSKKKKEVLDRTGSFDRKSAFCAFAPGRHFQSFISWYLSESKLCMKWRKTPVDKEDLVGEREWVFGGMVKR